MDSAAQRRTYRGVGSLEDKTTYAFLFQGFFEMKRVYSIIASAKNTAVEKEGGLRVDLCFLSLGFYRILF